MDTRRGAHFAIDGKNILIVSSNPTRKMNEFSHFLCVCVLRRLRPEKGRSSWIRVVVPMVKNIQKFSLNLTGE